MPRMIERIAHPANLETACRKVKANKGSAGVDGMGVEELSEYMEAHKEEISNGLLKGTYKPQPARRVYIPKPNGKKRPLGIPTVVDRVIQQAVSQQLSQVYEPVFSEYSYGFRPDRWSYVKKTDTDFRESADTANSTKDFLRFLP